MGYLFLFIISMFCIYTMLGGAEVLVIIIGALIIGGVVVYVSSSKEQKEIKSKLDELLPGYEKYKVVLAKTDNKYMFNRYFIDDASNKLIKFSNENKDLTYFDISNIVKCELAFNDEYINSTSRGSQLLGAAVGGLALGGIGAIIGGLSAKKISKKAEIDKATITIFLDDVTHSIEELKLERIALAETASEFERKVKEFYAVLLLCMAKSEKNFDNGMKNAHSALRK